MDPAECMWFLLQAGDRRGILNQLLGAAAPPASAENIEAIVAMGFSRDQVIQALTRCHNDVTQATHYLLTNGWALLYHVHDSVTKILFIGTEIKSKSALLFRFWNNIYDWWKNIYD